MRQHSLCCECAFGVARKGRLWYKARAFPLTDGPVAPSAAL